ncbi:MAG: hypothetical protein A2622_10925 [Bdellovibrionales bacterium RIFCSPHIGHO2_01_FULL_40_29]|nr:MAG: hypothetical protein A2622_10925 [Bdellovibrionales bacterium RIFCSPHIGHO2_01_FULL_40_29]OFZ34467.1 MAG: hypothetical protein A3D17_01190 [Bdellovibrionales bacterium RIFCSPHIGHO2_02_FULL_40_15]
MKITVIGTGYVGLVTGLGFAELGHHVLCYDHDNLKIESLKNGIVPFYEAQTEKVLLKHLNKRIHFTSNLATAITHANILFFCIGLTEEKTLRAQTAGLMTLIKSISEASKNKLIVLKSTAPIGTHQLIQKKFPNLRLVTNPEFLSEGQAIKDFMKPHRVIIGTSQKKDASILTRIYSPLVKSTSQIIIMDAVSAELTKHSANAMLATRVSFINEISRLCELTGGNIDLIKRGIGTDPRIGLQFLNAGIGYGGSCLPKDILALDHAAKASGETLHLIRAVKKTNQIQLKNSFQKIKTIVQKNKIKSVTVWGLSFKPKTDDLRESPALALLQKIMSLDLNIKVCDSVAKKPFEKLKWSRGIEFHHDIYTSLKGSELLLILTEWPQFTSANLKKIKSTMKKPILFDGRNIFDPLKMKKMGFEYHSVGRPL